MRDVHEAELHEVTEFCEAKLFDVDCGVFTSAVHCPRELGYAERSQELKPYEPEADNTDGGSISFSQAYSILLGASALFGKFSGRRFSFFKNNLFEKGKC